MYCISNDNIKAYIVFQKYLIAMVNDKQLT